MTSSPQNSPLSELNDFTYVMEPDADVAYARLARLIREMRSEGISHQYIRDAMLPQMLDLAAAELVHPDREKLLDDLQFVNYVIERSLRRHEQLMRQHERHFGEVPGRGSV